MQPYLAMIRTDPDRGFTIEYPDLPDCRGDAATLPEVQALARDLLSRHLAVLRSRGVPPPEPRNMKDLRDSGLADGAIPVLVPAPLEADGDPAARA